VLPIFKKQISEIPKNLGFNLHIHRNLLNVMYIFSMIICCIMNDIKRQISDKILSIHNLEFFFVAENTT
jgi:hypothetical protein